MKVAIGGGTPAPLASSVGTAGDIAIDSASVYWDGNGTNCSTNVGIYTVPKSGGGVTSLGSTSSAFGTHGMVIDSGGVYFTQNGYMSTPSNLWFVAKGGGTVTSLATGKDANIGQVAVDSTFVYWFDTDTVYKTPIGGGASTPIVTLASLRSVVVDSTNLYWTSATTLSDGKVTKMPTAGGGATDLASGLSLPGGAIVDSTSVYWFNAYGTPTIMKAPIVGGVPITLATGGASALTVDGTSLYWLVSGTSGKVMKVTPK